MKEILFIGIDIPQGLEAMAQYEDLRPGLDELRSEDFSYDDFIHEGLSGLLKDNNYQLIVLPYSLDISNYLNFTGIRVGLHIRLTPNWRHQQKPLLFLGPESSKEIIKLAPNAHLFMTSGIFNSSKNDAESVARQIAWIQQNKPGISAAEYQDFITKTHITPPDFYDNRHSIANEWGMHRLDEIAGTHLLNGEKEASHNLYFKYLIAKNAHSRLRNPAVEKIEKQYRVELKGLTIKGKIDLSKFK